jgi:hypothetical protein
MYGMIDKGFLPTCRVSLILYYRITTWLLEPLWSRKLIIKIIYNIKKDEAIMILDYASRLILAQAIVNIKPYKIRAAAFYLFGSRATNSFSLSGLIIRENSAILDNSNKNV